MDLIASSLIREDRIGLLAAVSGSAALLLTLVLIPLVRTLARRFEAVDHPGLGKMHAGATPYFGGLAIGGAALVLPPALQGWSREAAYVLIAAAMVSVTGLVDDLRDLHPFSRLGVEVVASLLAVKGGARVQLFGGWTDVVITVVSIVVVTNSFNLLDNMDGVAGTIAVATSGALLTAALLERQVLVASLSAAVVGGCIGFLVYNWHPASIFMGDAGSLLLGFLIAVTALKLRAPTDRFDSITAVLLILAVPLFDTSLVVISRLRAGRSMLQGGKDHTSHRLNRLGLPIRWVAGGLGVTSVVCAGSGVLVARGVVDPFVAVPVAAVVGASTLLPLLRMQVYGGADASRESRGSRPATG
jgi:UDP-GlcNAc:undecaprenyl-phosphate/decaprenyl-phosphate GlcNAc-1-phosphate transferase